MSDPYRQTPPPSGPPQTLAYAGLGTLPTLDNRDRADKAVRYLRIYAWLSIIAYIISLPFLFLTAMGFSIDDTGGLLLLVSLIPLALLGFAAFVVFVLPVIFYMMWQYRAYWNARAARFDASLMTSGWSVGWWFIPIVNLFMPRRILADLWAATNGEQDRQRPGLPGTIYMCWIGYFIIGVAGSVSFELIGEFGRSQPAFWISVGCDLVGGAIYIIFVWLLAGFVRIVQERQEAPTGWSRTGHPGMAGVYYGSGG